MSVHTAANNAIRDFFRPETCSGRWPLLESMPAVARVHHRTATITASVANGLTSDSIWVVTNHRRGANAVYFCRYNPAGTGLALGSTIVMTTSRPQLTIEQALTSALGDYAPSIGAVFGSVRCISARTSIKVISVPSSLTGVNGTISAYAPETYASIQRFDKANLQSLAITPHDSVIDAPCLVGACSFLGPDIASRFTATKIEDYQNTAKSLDHRLTTADLSTINGLGTIDKMMIAVSPYGTITSAATDHLVSSALLPLSYFNPTGRISMRGSFQMSASAALCLGHIVIVYQSMIGSAHAYNRERRNFTCYNSAEPPTSSNAAAQFFNVEHDITPPEGYTFLAAYVEIALTATGNPSLSSVSIRYTVDGFYDEDACSGLRLFNVANLDVGSTLQIHDCVHLQGTVAPDQVNLTSPDPTLTVGNLQLPAIMSALFNDPRNDLARVVRADALSLIETPSFGDSELSKSAGVIDSVIGFAGPMSNLFRAGGAWLGRKADDYLGFAGPKRTRDNDILL